MADIITGTGKALAFFDGTHSTDSTHAFGIKGDFHKPALRAFAGLSAFAANSNHAPSGEAGAVTCDAGLELLFRIAGAR